jgi:GNAT superfamily N-acetyltransferase
MMNSKDTHKESLEFHPLTAERWADFEELFGEHGAYGGCWCMWWRLTRREFEEGQGEGNREAMRSIVLKGEVPGILAYEQGRAVGWCSVAPREDYGSLNRSRVLKRIDDRKVWSIVCFFVTKDHRRQGLMQKLIRAAIDYVQSQGGKVVEAYPSIPRSERVPPVSIFMGFPSIFEKEGFIECAHPSKSKVVMRYLIEGDSQT